nr:hypothetical protein GCM10017745_48130 [Saccharothrix mutabilis subsp. capreolus]
MPEHRGSREAIASDDFVITDTCNGRDHHDIDRRTSTQVSDDLIERAYLNGRLCDAPPRPPTRRPPVRRLHNRRPEPGLPPPPNARHPRGDPMNPQVTATADDDAPVTG